MTLWQLLRQLVGFSRREYAVALVLQPFRLGLWFAPAFVIRELFNWLSSGAPLDWNYWSLVALVLALPLARIGALLCAVGMESLTFIRSTELIRVNLFERWLRRVTASSAGTALGQP